MARVTKTQIAAMQEIERSLTGTLIFGSGYGRFRVALRPLVHRHDGLLTYFRRDDGAEQFGLTDAGREVLAAVQGERT